MAEEKERPGRGFRLLTEGGAEKFLLIPVPLAQGAGQPPPNPPAAPSSAMGPEPEPRKETKQERLVRLEKEYADLIGALYFVQNEITVLRESE